MTFDKLLNGIKSGCDCTKFGKPSNTADIYARGGANNPPTLSDFDSYHESGLPRSGNSCKNHCQHRGVSMDKVSLSELDKLKQAWRDQKQFKPILPDFRYIFNLLDGCGLVWETPTEKNQAHRDLLKSDAFGLNSLTLIETVDLV